MALKLGANYIFLSDLFALKFKQQADIGLRPPEVISYRKIILQLNMYSPSLITFTFASHTVVLCYHECVFVGQVVQFKLGCLFISF